MNKNDVIKRFNLSPSALHSVILTDNFCLENPLALYLVNGTLTLIDFTLTITLILIY
jgi:hypothetical protein